MTRALAALLSACGGGVAPPLDAGVVPIIAEAADPAADPAIPEAPAPDPAPEPLEGPDGPVSATVVSFVGTWTSASCGDRGYAREVDLKQGGTYTGRDLVSPCPPNARCVWSGIVLTSGLWRQDGAVIVLTETKAERGDLARPRPQWLHYDPVTSQLYEEDGEARCLYEPGRASASLRPIPKD